MKTKIVGLVIFMSAIIPVVGGSPVTYAAQTCSTNNSFDTLPTFSSSIQTAADNAAAWVYSMMAPLSDGTVYTETIGFDSGADTSFAYTGNLTGTFSEPDGATISNPSSLQNLSPSVVPDAYRGIVTGDAPVVTTAGTHEVRAYKYTDAEYLQPEATPAPVASDGTWSIDLSAVPGSRLGSWRFRLYQIAPETQIGLSWQGEDSYDDHEIRLYSVIDADYLQDSQPAGASLTWSLDAVGAGTKKVELYNTNTSTVLASFAVTTGLVRSYNVEVGETGYGTGFQQNSYTYDQALALSMAVARGDDAIAKQMIEGLLLAQRTDVPGAFPFSVPQLAPTIADPYIRTGAHAIVIYSLLKYIEAYPSDPDIETYRTAVRDAFAYADTKLSSDGLQAGLYTGGQGRYTSGGAVFEPAFIIPWASTEHNLDMWHSLTLAERVLPGEGYGDRADTLQEAILEQLWDDSRNRFYQGIIDTTTPDTADALDTNSWGAIFLHAINETEKFNSAMERVEDYKYTRSGATGYAPYITDGEYPGAEPTVWFEGTWGVSMALLRGGSEADYIQSLNDAIAGQNGDGSFDYATDPVSAYEIATYESIASTAWLPLASTLANDFWSECQVLGASTTAPPAASTESSTPLETLADTGAGVRTVAVTGIALVVMGGYVGIQKSYYKHRGYSRRFTR